VRQRPQQDGPLRGPGSKIRTPCASPRSARGGSSRPGQGRSPGSADRTLKTPVGLQERNERPLRPPARPKLRDDGELRRPVRRTDGDCARSGLYVADGRVSQKIAQSTLRSLPAGALRRHRYGLRHRCAATPKNTRRLVRPAHTSSFDLRRLASDGSHSHLRPRVWRQLEALDLRGSPPIPPVR
jgi:hypothetical protein